MNETFSLNAHFATLPAVTAQKSFISDYPPADPPGPFRQTDNKKLSRLLFNCPAPNPVCSRPSACGGQLASRRLAMQTQEDNAKNLTDTGKLLKEQGLDADAIQ